jgi:hypothetical protein
MWPISVYTRSVNCCILPYLYLLIFLLLNENVSIIICNKMYLFNNYRVLLIWKYNYTMTISYHMWYGSRYTMTNSYHIEIEYHYDQFVHIFIMVKFVSPVVDTWMFWNVWIMVRNGYGAKYIWYEIAIVWYEMVNYGTKWLWCKIPMVRNCNCVVRNGNLYTGRW